MAGKLEQNSMNGYWVRFEGEDGNDANDSAIITAYVNDPAFMVEYPDAWSCCRQPGG